MGPVTDYSNRALTTGPLRLLIKDIGVLITALPYLPLVFFPITLTTAKQDGHSRWASFRDIAVQALLCLIELILLILFIPALVSLPGLIFIAALIASILLIKLVAWPTQGPRLVDSAVDGGITPVPHERPTERWIFINGICTGRSGLQQNINHISLLFGRKVLGIHNQSYGMIGDIVECLLQRCFLYSTMDVRVAIEVVKKHLVDPEVRKVVLLAHSQGGIIASMVVDHLLTELSGECMGKLEIYTFGSAASHFHDPPINTTTSVESSPCIQYIEHYANEYDMVPRWGVLYAVKRLLTNRYAGKVYVRMGATGHMFVDHYLDPIFLSPKQARSKTGPATNMKQVNGHMPEEEAIEDADSFLNALVDVDVDVEERQAQKASKRLVQVKSSGQAHAHSTPVAKGVGGHSVNGTHDLVNGVHADDVDDLMMNLDDNRGKTVKELSRLWQYLGGAEPEESSQ
ncbi:MAG: hypothetical protein LQ343_001165 [Gyalolechia ehrenbergii]|nr:MAG: hypothetical protein LQ343_001165 [Gyalolechia ehrenbergii]